MNRVPPEGTLLTKPAELDTPDVLGDMRRMHNDGMPTDHTGIVVGFECQSAS